MGFIPITALFSLLVTASNANRNERVAAGRPVGSPYTYPWVVYIESVYQYRTEERRRRITCPGSCTGSFIDIYGSVLTAAHCVLRETKCKISNNVSIPCHLHHISVTWGVIEPIRNANTTELVRPRDNRIMRFEHVVESEPATVEDIAIIYLTTFQVSPMTCNQQSLPRPINIDPTRYAPDWSQVGIFAGFGAQPAGYNEEESRYCYIDAGPLTEIALRYDDEFIPTCLCNNQSCYNAYAEFYERPPDTGRRHPQVGGTCYGDSGGPYMVKEHKSPKRMILRGTLSGGPNYKYHLCSGFSNPNYFVKVSSKEVRNWLVKELNDTYINKQLHASRVPAACEAL